VVVEKAGQNGGRLDRTLTVFVLLQPNTGFGFHPSEGGITRHASGGASERAGPRG
jgi:hypothetical protein